ncbi:hypothetical protein P389DRAFT_166517 [Cystobasidium minutum MCA 4210]|uniref:uncharacterized protein n=1 Tax=Cystobasidium minutum MCA 4210 TaxID=1397322 RepID=UPI0034CF5F13|eukprot:jgi/Rhomi1/166517/fgenesh1_kg.2_\
MGAAESRSLTSTSTDPSLRGRTGFHVLRVADNSPAAEAGIEPFFDYVVGVDGQPLSAGMAGPNASPNLIEEMLAKVVEEHEGHQLALQIWSSKRMELRECTVIPSRDWSASRRIEANGQETSEVSLHDHDSQPSLLGLSLRLCNPDGALEKVWHVLEILEGSPAESAGLVPFGDYILGYSGGVLHKESDFYNLVEEHVDKPLRLFVYNADFDVTREVVIIPNRAWSSGGAGEGLLGCGVGYGVLHRIPKPQAPAKQGNAHSSSHVTSEAHQYASSNGGYDVHSPPTLQPKPTRMTASIQPSTPTRGGQAQQAWKGGNLDQARLGAGSPGRSSPFGMGPPPRSPSAASHRSSVAEIIEEEEE